MSCIRYRWTPATELCELFNGEQMYGQTSGCEMAAGYSGKVIAKICNVSDASAGCPGCDPLSGANCEGYYDIQEDDALDGSAGEFVSQIPGVCVCV